MNKVNLIRSSVIAGLVYIPCMYFWPVPTPPPSVAPHKEAFARHGNLGKTCVQVREEYGKPDNDGGCRISTTKGDVFPGKVLVYIRTSEDMVIAEAVCFIRGIAVSEKLVSVNKKGSITFSIWAETIDYNLLQRVMAESGPTPADRVVVPGPDDLDI